VRDRRRQRDSRHHRDDAAGHVRDPGSVSDGDCFSERVRLAERDGQRVADRSGEPAKLEKNLNIYTWAEYQDEDNIKNFTKELGPKVKIDEYDSNEAMIAKLELAKGSAGYDIVVPTGVFVTQMVQKGLLRKLDKSKIPNFANLEEAFLDQPWDPGNEYSVVKDWGSTGYLWDSKGLKDDIKTWATSSKRPRRSAARCPCWRHPVT
jgi:spermidine/putrescine-binding protein